MKRSKQALNNVDCSHIVLHKLTINLKIVAFFGYKKVITLVIKVANETGSFTLNTFSSNIKYFNFKLNL